MTRQSVVILNKRTIDDYKNSPTVQPESAPGSMNFKHSKIVVLIYASFHTTAVKFTLQVMD